MAAMTCFKANRRRIQAAVDERLMKGFSGNFFFKITSSPHFPGSGEPVYHEDEIQVQRRWGVRLDSGDTNSPLTCP
jgi:hypothetical protein